MVTLRNDEERDLWKRVYVAAISTHYGADENADAAVRAYRARLPKGLPIGAEQD